MFRFDQRIAPVSRLRSRCRICLSALGRFAGRISPDKRHIAYLLLIILVSTILKFVFVFKGTDYASYISSDMGGYWTRAFERLYGKTFSINQWVIWPPLFHILLAEIFKIAAFLAIPMDYLSLVLSINILLSSASVAYLYGIALQLTRNRRLSLWSAALYAFTYHVFYFNAFILSENFAIPIVMAAIYYLLRDRKGCYLVSGLLLAIGTGIRPGFGLLAVSFGLFALFSHSKSLKRDWKETIFFKGVAKSAIFSVGFLSVLLLILVENNHISHGQLNGLGASSGLNYFFSFTKTYEVRSKFGGYEYVIIPPGTVREPENGKLITTKPIYDSAFFRRLANAYIQDHPQILLWKIKDIWDLYFGTLFPAYGSVFGYHYFMIPFRIVFFILTLFVFFSFVTMPMTRCRPGGYLVLLSVVLFSFILAYMYNSEHRYIFGFVFALYPLGLDAIAETAKNFRKYRKKLAIMVMLIATPFMVNAAWAAMQRAVMNEVVLTTITPFNGDKTARQLYVDTLNFPFNPAFTHKTMGSLGLKRPFTVEFTGMMSLAQDGQVQFLLFCEEGFQLFIDGASIMHRAVRSDEKAAEKMVFLSQGEHRFTLRYTHRSGYSGIKAMYAPIENNRYKRYFIGENSGMIRFYNDASLSSP